MPEIQFSRSVSLSGRYDTVVCGGGPAGWVAAVASARQGMRTALIEKMSYLGGMATAGLVVPISRFCHKGDRVVGGIAWEMVERMEKIGAAQPELPSGHVSVDPEIYKLTAQEMVLEAGVDLYTNCTLIGCETQGRKVTQIIFSGKNGLEALEGDYFIDATGDSELSNMAGVEMITISDELQPMSMCFLLDNVDITTDLLKYCIHHDGRHGRSVNKDIHNKLLEMQEAGEDVPQFGGPWFNSTLHGGLLAVNVTRSGSNGADRVELTKAECTMRRDAYRLVELLRKAYPEFKNAFIAEIAAQGGIRETRHISGLHQLTGDELREGYHPLDSVAFCAHPIDIHATHGNNQICIELPLPGAVPFRSLVPTTHDNLMSAGRGACCDRDAFASLRVQATCMAMGEAAGVAAALCRDYGCTVPNLNAQNLHDALLSQNCIV